MKFAAASAIALSVLGLWIPAAQACAKPVRAAMMAWPPYFYAGDLGSAVGADTEIMQAIFNEAGCRLEVGEEVPRKRRLAMFMAGDLDMIPGSSDTPERREYAWFSKPYRNETVSIFTLPAKLERYRDVRGFEDVLNRRITLLSLNSGWFGPAYEQYIGRLREAKLSSTFEGFAQGLVMLSKERGELIMADHATMLTEAARLKMDPAPLPHKISHAPAHMMFNKKTVPEADVLLLDAAAERLESRGVLKQIRRNYGMQ